MYIVDKYFSEVSEEKLYSVVVDETEFDLYSRFFASKAEEEDYIERREKIARRIELGNKISGTLLGAAGGGGLATFINEEINKNKGKKNKSSNSSR